MRRFALVCVLCAFASSASGQIFYEPVQYQYGQQCNTYYYGGSDPRVHYYAQFPIGGGGRFGRAGGWQFASGDIRVHREVCGRPPIRVFTDSLPFRYDNAAFAGFTANDARNDAYFNAPTYFKKSELVAAAVPVDGAWVVPAQAQPVPLNGASSRVAAPPATAPRPLMIIPKDQLQQKKSDKVFAATK